MDPDSMRRRHPTCQVVVAAAGYGKTTALRRWFPTGSAHWHRATGPTLSRVVADAAAAGAGRIVVDDLPELTTDEVDALADTLGALPATISVVLSSRWPLPSPRTRSPGRSLWTDLGPADLALTAGDVGGLIADEYHLRDPELGDLVHEATGGWPALVHLTAEALRLDGVPHGPLATALGQPGGLLAAYVTDQVLAGLPPVAVRLLRQVGELSPVSAGLCRALGHRSPDETVGLLRRTGLLTRTGRAAVPGAPAPADRVVPVVAEVLRHGTRRPAASRVAATAGTAAAWYERNGPAVAAARSYRRAADDAGCARVLDQHGDRMIEAGQASSVADLVAALPERLRTRRLRLLLGDALRTLGDLDAADRAYRAVASTGPAPDAGLAWRIGRISYQRGDARAALAAFERGYGVPAAPVELAHLLTWTAHAHLLAGDAETATGYARRAVLVAVDAGNDGALATAHLGVALCRAVAGDTATSEEHFALALPLAERAGDVLLLTRIHTNRTHQLLRTTRLAEALATAQQSARYAEAAGSPSLLAIATTNEAEALAMLGRYDEAVRRYESALWHYQRKGSRRFAAALLGLGELYRRRGWREQAQAAYEEAVAVTEATGNAHVLVPALAGLAMLLLEHDPDAAAAHAHRAADLAPAEIVVPALLAQGWVALHRADLERAGSLATEAARIARGQRDRAGLADALELRAASDTDLTRVRAALAEAHAIWVEAGAAVEAARLLVALGRLPGADTEARLAGLLAAEQLTEAGAVPARAASTAAAPTPGRPATEEVVIRALGRFEVHVGGRAVPASQWQSRKARDLLRILIARQGRPVPRGELCDLLWPQDGPEKTGHRLSVLLSIIRSVLDPAKARAPDHFLVADQASIALEVSRVRLDVADFLAHVGYGRRLVERGALTEARTVLGAADRLYRADAFEDEPYADWSGPLREQARAAYLSMLRMLARCSRAAGAPAAAAGYLLRLLERDPYDEPAHRALVRTLVAGGQHGEARRAFDRYTAAMRTIGVRPPDQVILVPARPDRSPQRAGRATAR